MVRVHHILENKGTKVWSVAPETSVYDALVQMADKGVGALLVMEGPKLVGVFSERDYARKVILQGKASKDVPVRDIMSSKVYFVSPHQAIEECMALMTNRSIRHLPVMDGDDLVGLISIGDVVKAVISKQEFIIEQLEQFIMGR